MKTFEKPEINVIKLEVEDIITTSLNPEETLPPVSENELPWQP